MDVTVAGRRQARAPLVAPQAPRSDGVHSAARPPAPPPKLAQMRHALNTSPRVRATAAIQRKLNGDIAQLAKLNLRNNGTISGVSSWPHRPPSNVSGKQGQHLTAYVAFQDMILSHVRDRTPKQAANALIGLLGDMAKLPGGEYWLKQYGNIVDINVNLLTDAAKDNDDKMVGGVIDNILGLRNVMPDTALGTKEKTPGHGEAGTSGSLEVLETVLRQNGGNLPNTYDANDEANAALFNMWRLLDYQPSSGASEESFEKTKMRVLRHVMQMRLSYPQVFNWLTGRGAWLMPYLKNNRTDDGMPLSYLDNGEIDEITTYVHKNL